MSVQDEEDDLLMIQILNIQGLMVLLRIHRAYVPLYIGEI